MASEPRFRNEQLQKLTLRVINPDVQMWCAQHTVCQLFDDSFYGSSMIRDILKPHSYLIFVDQINYVMVMKKVSLKE